LIVIPAVDILGGQAVRLLHGDYDRVTDTRGDPVALAREWAAAGARLIHAVDLDGARAGRPVNSATIKNLCRGVDVPVEVSGGLRNAEAVATMLDGGAARVVLGTVALKDHALLRMLVEHWGPERIVVGIDARDGLVATEGWREGSRTAATDLAREVVALGVRELIYTDIGCDGTLAGPNLAALKVMIDAVRPSPPTHADPSLGSAEPTVQPALPAAGEGGDGRTPMMGEVDEGHTPTVGEKVSESSTWGRGRLARPGVDPGTGEMPMPPETPLPLSRRLFTDPPLKEGSGVRVIASGGVGALDHLRQLRDVGAAGAIVGRALYTGALDLATAMRTVQQENQGQ